MGILDEIKQEQSNAKLTRCRVGLFLEGLDKAERQEVEEALADGSYMHTTISKVITARGVDVGAGAVSNHRRGICGCSRR